jgi:hypothetical protein
VNAELHDGLANQTRSLMAVRHLVINAEKTGRKFYMNQAAVILETVATDVQFLAMILATDSDPTIPPPTHRPAPKQRKAKR